MKTLAQLLRSASMQRLCGAVTPYVTQQARSYASVAKAGAKNHKSESARTAFVALIGTLASGVATCTLIAMCDSHSTCVHCNKNNESNNKNAPANTKQEVNAAKSPASEAKSGWFSWVVGSPEASSGGATVKGSGGEINSGLSKEVTKADKSTSTSTSTPSPNQISNALQFQGTVPVGSGERRYPTPEYEETAILTRAPRVPPPIERDYPALVKVYLKTTSKVMQLTNSLKYEFWTFNDCVPGPMMRVRQGDVVELHLENLEENPHNVDMHAFEGPGGGASITLAQQGETKVARFRCLYPGLFVYHCAAAPVPAHIMNGMYGMILVEPEEGLPKVDKEYYVMQSEFYHEPLDATNGNRIVEPSYPRGLDETADVVVFNGKEGALTVDSPLSAAVGEKVRIFFGNAGPNLMASFHVIGAIFNKVFREGDITSPPARYVQTTVVPPGGSTVVEIEPRVPGTMTIVDHAIFRLDKGAVGYMHVSGEARPDLYSGGAPNPCVGCKLHP